MSKPTLYVGIDPGQKGAVFACHEDNVAWAHWVTPVHDEVTTTKKRKTGKVVIKHKYTYQLRSMWMILYNISRLYHPFVVLEQGQSMPGQGVHSMFVFGYGCGLWEGMLVALNVPYVTVRGGAWHKQLCGAFAHNDPKEDAIALATSSFPTVNFKLTERCTTPHIGIIDAACLALYAKHHFGSGKKEESVCHQGS